jgi:hypothetical protein
MRAMRQESPEVGLTGSEGRARRRRRSALLSALAAGVTAALFVWDGLSREAYGPHLVWLLWIGLPTVAVSAAAAIQYRWKTHSGAGAAGAVVYWVFIVVFSTQEAGAFLIGAILQTCAWYISRPGRRAPG